MTQFLNLKSKVEEINKLIEEKIVSDNPNLKPIKDGIIDIEKYYNAKYKILWILKEPYDDFDEDGEPEGGGWSLEDLFKDKNTIEQFGGGIKTFKPMIYASWGILNNFCQWDDMKNVEDSPSMLDALKSVAYINVKKLPGNTTSKDAVIANAYQQHKEILLKQIKDYNPDIIIGGSTLHYFYQDLGITNEEMQQNNNILIKDNKIYIAAYHPAQRQNTTGLSEEEYCNIIINAAKNWAKNSLL